MKWMVEIMFWRKQKCKSFKPKYSDYPASLYADITDDPDSWGMCCSKEMAYKCAEEYYDNYIRKGKYDFLKTICLGVFIVALMMIPIFMMVF